ncbi:DUF2272 domain-containing protein [Lichenihabitans psoromatis]|nr:DUF2272 domain-containing protein [Lichenihabitans psoromatis]
MDVLRAAGIRDLAGRTIRQGHKEAEPVYADRIAHYWVEGTGTHGLSGTNDVPWSAAFISWIMQAAGAGDRFRYSTEHSVYIAQAIRDRQSGRAGGGFWVYRLDEREPAVGDLICWARQPGLDFDHQLGGRYLGHCDLVVAVDQGAIWVIGGNVGNSVTKRPIALIGKHVPAATMRGETPFAVLQDRIGAPVASAPSAAAGGPGCIAWGAAVPTAFKAAVLDIASELACDPSHLMAAMAFETGEAFSAKSQNPHSLATGLIQFTPSTAIGLGTTVESLAAMTEVSQLAYVLAYLLPFQGRMGTLPDLYMAILLPTAVGKPDGTVLFSKPSLAYFQNIGLDANRDGEITKSEAASKVQAALTKRLTTHFAG